MAGVKINFWDEPKKTEDREEMNLVLAGQLSEVSIKFNPDKMIKYARTIICCNESIIQDDPHGSLAARAKTYHCKEIPVKSRISNADALHPYAWKLVFEQNGFWPTDFEL